MAQLRSLLGPVLVVILSALVAGACTNSQVDDATGPSTVLVWVPGGVPDEVSHAVGGLDGVDEVTGVLGGILDLASSSTADGALVDQTADGRTIPLDTLAYDPTTFKNFTDPSTIATLSALQPEEAILSTTSAKLRDIGVGGSLTLASGDTLSIKAVLDDDVVAAAEVVVSPEAAHHLGVDTSRFLLAHVDRSAVEAVALVRSAASTDGPLRVVSTGDVSWERHGDQVLPQALVKDRFGEFSARSAPDGKLSPDPGWVDANIVTEAVPLLGTVTCHRAIIEPLRRALGQLESEGLGDTIDAEGYKGCYYPRAIEGLPYLSRHSWGIALDLNIASDERGRDVEYAPELVAAMSDAGFTSGADWPLPDPAHFEYVASSVEPPR